MKIEYDPKVKAVYIHINKKLKPGEAKSTKEIDDSINIDLDKDGKVIGIEVLNIESFAVEVY
mgnify:CR=1 FL=1